MNYWETYNLSDICRFVTSRTCNIENYISTENMLPNKGGITSPSNIPSGSAIAYQLGDVLISNIRPYFQKIWQANCDGACSADVLCIRANEKADCKYLYYLLSQQKFFDYVMSGAKGCKMPRGDKSQIMQWQISLPPLAEQKRIADILSAIDDKIELNRRINANLEQQAQALYKSWFVDFEPFGGKMPEDWKEGRLEDIGEVVGGGTPSKSISDYYTSNGIAWITPKDLSLTHAKFTSKGEIDITELGYVNSSAKLMPRGSILFSSRAPIGYISIAKNDVCTNQGFKSVIPYNGCTAYIYYYLLANTLNIEAQASGSTFKEASGTLMKSQKIIIPNDITLTQFECIMQPIFTKQEKLEEENKNLTTLRDTLLPKLMSGEIKI
jgi:type I restriction enzyme S subunit